MFVETIGTTIYGRIKYLIYATSFIKMKVILRNSISYKSVVYHNMQEFNGIHLTPDLIVAFNYK